MNDHNANPSSDLPVANANTAPLDLDKLRLSQNFQQEMGARRVVNTVPVRKPHRQEFVRTRAGQEWGYPTLVLHLKIPGELYLVAKDLWDVLAHELTPMQIVLAATRFDDCFLWPLRLPRSDGRQDSWSESARVAAVRAEHTFVRLTANQAQGAYDLLEAVGTFPEPTWPELSMPELLNLAFKGRYIDSMDHAVVRQLLGQ